MPTVDLVTGARLHFGLICGTEKTGWIFGGIGMMLRSPGWRLRLTRKTPIDPDANTSASASADTSADTSADDVVSMVPLSLGLTEKIREILQTIRSCTTDCGNFRVEVLQQIPRHAGYGSGTQLALALSAGVQTLLGPQAHQPTDEAARHLQRAQRSSIGTKGFERGGFLIDFGKQAGSAVERRFERIEIPEHWRFVTIRPVDHSGLCGESERQYFDRGLTMPAELVGAMADLIEHQLRPSLIAGDLTVFARSLGRYGQLAGEFYSQEQGGIFTIPDMSELSDHLNRQGYPGTAQSSWGPTVCVPVSSTEDAHRVQQIAARFAESRSLSWTIEINEPLNQGALIRMPLPDGRRII